MTDRMALLDADRSARRLAQTEFERPLVLEAGAGTGKTTTLVARLLAWTLGPGWERAAARLAARAGDSGRTGDSAREIDDERIAAEVLSGVVAITFTEAAAAEMAHRAARDLAEVAKSFGRVPGWLEAAPLPPEAERVRRAWALLATLDQLNVSTIHAFCRRLLAEHPLEAGVHPQLTVDADGRLLDEAVQEAVEGAMRSGYGEPGDRHLLTLAARGLGPRELVEALLTLAREGLPAEVLLNDPLSGPGAAALSRRLLDAARELKNLLPARFKGRAPNAEKVAAAIHQLVGCFAGVESVGLEALSPVCSQVLPENLVNHLANWEKGSFNQAEDTAFADRAEAVAAAAGRFRRAARFLLGFDAELLTAARGALAPLLATVETAMRTRGAATFQSLLSGAARLLSNHPGVRREVRGRIDQLLVDEFQDTDRQQCALLAALALPDPSAPDAPLPGLFLVGDPKQSIYGWRSADLSAYSGFVARVRAAGGAVLPLVENFRSVPGILAEVAVAVAPVMRERTGLQPAFQPLLPCEKLDEEEGFAAAGRRPVEHWVLWRPEGANAADAPGLGKTPLVVAAELEAEAVARDIAELHEREGVAWNSFGILLRGFGSVEIVLEALRARRIPFAVGRDRQYYRRREIIEASALVRSVLDPGDHLALLTWLRSAAVGVPDAALIPLWGRGFPRLASELGGTADPVRAAEALQQIAELAQKAALATPRDVPGITEIAGWEASLEAAMAALAAMRRSFATDAADLFVEKLRRFSFMEPTESARYLGPYRLANLDRFFRRLLEAFEEEGDAGALLRVLRRSITEGLDAEEARPDGGEAAVSVLTIHGAKGLDFDHVYLLQTHRQPPADNEIGTAVGRVGSPAAEPGDDRWEVRLFGAPTPGFAEVEAERAAVEAAERVRTLYVALTRAKVRLVISGLWTEREANPDNAPGDPGNLAERARSHLHLLTARPGRPDLLALWKQLEGAEPREPSWIDGDGVLWRFPGLEAAAPVSSKASQKAPAAGLPPYGTGNEVAAAVRDLAKRREEAATRQKRRISAPASEEAHERLRQLQAEQAESAAESPEATLATLAVAANTATIPDVENRRKAAMAAGTAVHRALETWDLEADVAVERARQIESLPGTLAALAGIDPETRHAAEVRARGLIEAFAAGPLVERLRSLGTKILARELPVLLPAQEDHGQENGPVGFISGAIDLLYREEGEGTDRFVIVDYKTDDVQREDELKARAAAYAPQGAWYTRAIRDALGLTELPRFELWFLAAGSVVRLDR